MRFLKYSQRIKQKHKGLKETRKKINEENENNSRKIEIVRRNQAEIWKLKNTTELKYSLDKFNIQYEQAEDRINEHKYKTIEIIKSEEQKNKI